MSPLNVCGAPCGEGLTCGLLDGHGIDCQPMPSTALCECGHEEGFRLSAERARIAALRRACQYCGCEHYVAQASAPMPLTTELGVRESEVAVTLIVDLIARMERAHATLLDMVEIETDGEERERITTKATGVALCLSYAREALRMQP